MKRYVYIILILLLVTLFIPINGHANFTQVIDAGFGDSINVNIDHFEVFNGKLFAMVVEEMNCNRKIFSTSDGNTWGETCWFGSICSTSDMIVYGGYLFFSGDNAEVYRSDDGTNFSLVADHNDFSLNAYYLKFFTFMGKLYAGTDSWGIGGEVFSSFDGETWTICAQSSGGFGDTNNRAVDVGIQYNGYLYVGTYNYNSGSQIWRTMDGVNWSLIPQTDNGFGYRNVDRIMSLVEFEGDLYAYTRSGRSIFYTTDGTNWSYLNSPFSYPDRAIVHGTNVIVADNDYIYKTSDPVSGDWEVITSDAFGEDANIPDIAFYNNSLYCGISYSDNGCKIYSDLEYDYILVTSNFSLSSNVSAGDTNVTVLYGNLSDYYGHDIDSIFITNEGTMDSTEISNIKIWYDNNDNKRWDTGDTFIDTGLYNPGLNGYLFSGLNMTSGANIVFTIDLYITATNEHNFKAAIKRNYVACENGRLNVTSIENSHAVTIGNHFFDIEKTVDFYGTFSFDGTNGISIYFNDPNFHNITSLKISNMGTINGEDASLYVYDSIHLNGYIGYDEIIARLSWKSGEQKWVLGENAVLPSNRELFVLINTYGYIRHGETLKLIIKSNWASCENGSINHSTISNNYFLTNVDSMYLYKTVDAAGGNIGVSEVVPVLNFSINKYHDYWWDVKINIHNLGTMEDKIDIDYIHLKENGSYKGTFNYNKADDMWQCDQSFSDIFGNYSIEIGISPAARDGRTFQAAVLPGNFFDSYGYYTFYASSITNTNIIIITNSSHVVSPLVKAVGDDTNYSVTSEYSNKEVLSFLFRDSMGAHSLKSLKVTNLGTMLPGADYSGLKVWKDINKNSRYDSGIDILNGVLVYNNGKWTNDNLSIGHGTNVLVTINTEPTIMTGRTFKAAVISTNDLMADCGIYSSIVFTNEYVLAVELTAPSMPEIISYSPEFRRAYITCTSVTDSDFHRLLVAYDTSSHTNWSDYQYHIVSTNDIYNYGTRKNYSPYVAYITNLNDDTTYYIRVASEDHAGNITSSTQEVVLKTYGYDYQTLYNKKNPDIPQDNNLMLIGMEGFNNSLIVFTYNIDTDEIYCYSTTNGNNWSDASSGLILLGDYDIVRDQEVFKGYLYTGGFDSDEYGILQRMSPSGEWEILPGPSYSEEVYPTSMCVFNDRLYIGNYDEGGADIHRTSNGTNYELIDLNGFDEFYDMINILYVFDNKIYAVASDWYTSAIYSSSDGINWNVINDTKNSFNTGDYSIVAQLLEFNGELYAFLANEGYSKNSGSEIWKSSDGNSWQKIYSSSYFYIDVEFSAIEPLVVKSNCLYFIGRNDTDKEIQIVRSTDGINWSCINHDTIVISEEDDEILLFSEVFRDTLFIGCGEYVYDYGNGIQIWSDRLFLPGLPHKQSIDIIKNTNYPNENTGGKRVENVLNFKFIDSHEHSITEINITNLGTMKYPGDISQIQLYYESGPLIGNMTYSTSANKWNYSGAVNSGSDLLLKLTTASMGVEGRTFQACINISNTFCQDGYPNTNSITNSGILTRVDEVILTKNTNLKPYNVTGASNQVEVLAFNIQDIYGDNINSINVTNIGTMDDSDIARLVLWYDNDSNYEISGPDVTCSTASWNNIQKTWELNNINVFSGSNFIISVDTTPFSIIDRTFRAAIMNNYIICSNGVKNYRAITNDSGFTNKSGIHCAVVIKTNVTTSPSYVVKAGYTNKEILCFKFIDTTNHSLQKLKVSDLSNFDPVTDIENVKVWEDNNNITQWEITDNYMGNLSWDGFGWTNNSLNITSGSYVLVTVTTKTGLAHNKKLRAYVTASNLECELGIKITNSFTNDDILISDIVPPETVKYLSVTETTNSISLHYESTNSDVYFYRIGYSTNSKSAFVDYDNFTNVYATNCSITGLDNGEQYFVGVKACDNAGNYSINFTEYTQYTIDTHPPEFNGVTNYLKIQKSGQRIDITLLWAEATDNKTQTSQIRYKIYSSEVSGIYNTNQYSKVTNIDQYTITDHLEGIHYYRVRAVDTDDNEDSNMNEVCIIVELSETSLANAKVYPNPAFGCDPLSFGNLTENAIIKIYDTRSRLVKELIKSGGDGEHEWQHCNELDLASGVYIVLIINGKKTDEKVIRKFVYIK